MYAGTSGLDINTSAKAKNCVCVFAGAVSCHWRFANEAIVCTQAPTAWACNTSAEANNCVCVFAGAVSCHWRFANEAIVCMQAPTAWAWNTSAEAKNCVCVNAGAMACHCSEVNTSVKMHTDDACVKRFANEAIVCMQAPTAWTSTRLARQRTACA